MYGEQCLPFLLAGICVCANFEQGSAIIPFLSQVLQKEEKLGKQWKSLVKGARYLQKMGW